MIMGLDSSNLREQFDQTKGDQSDDEEVSEPVDDSTDESEAASTSETEVTPAEEAEREAEPTPDAEPEDDQESADDEDAAADPRETPAFPYAESFQRGLHPRKSSWDAYDDAMFYAEAELRKHDVKNIEKREFDDAVLRLAEEEPERLAELVMEARGLDPDDE